MNGAALLARIPAAQQGDRAVMEQLLTENSALIWSIVRRFYGRGAEPEDLFQLGSIGFFKAVRDFDASFGVQFSTYAVPKIAGEIRRFLRDDGMVKISRAARENAARVRAATQALSGENGESPRISQLCAATGLSAEEVTECLQLPTHTDSLDAALSQDSDLTLLQVLSAGDPENRLVEHISLRQAVERLEPRLRQVILLRYFRDFTQQKTADALGISQVQVSRLEKKAIAAIRAALAVHL